MGFTTTAAAAESAVAAGAAKRRTGLTGPTAAAESPVPTSPATEDTAAVRAPAPATSVITIATLTRGGACTATASTWTFTVMPIISKGAAIASVSAAQITPRTSRIAMGIAAREHRSTAAATAAIIATAAVTGSAAARAAEDAPVPAITRQTTAASEIPGRASAARLVAVEGAVLEDQCAVLKINRATGAQAAAPRPASAALNVEAFDINIANCQAARARNGRV